jgi:hypothetical protein
MSLPGARRWLRFCGISDVGDAISSAGAVHANKASSCGAKSRSLINSVDLRHGARQVPSPKVVGSYPDECRSNARPSCSPAGPGLSPHLPQDVTSNLQPWGTGVATATRTGHRTYNYLLSISPSRIRRNVVAGSRRRCRRFWVGREASMAIFQRHVHTRCCK